MRVIQKLIVDYNDIISEICDAAEAEDTEYILLLISAKTDIERAYGNQCANYSVLVTVFEDDPDEYTIIPHDYKL